MKKSKWKSFLKVFLCFVLASSVTQIAYAASGAYRDYSCPHTGTETAQKIGDACCWGCGSGSQRGVRHITEPAALRYYSPGTDYNGSGHTELKGTKNSITLNGKTYTNVPYTEYYLCYNCFVTGNNTDLIKTEYQTSEGIITVEGPYMSRFNSNGSKGDVPTKWCANRTCGPEYAGLVDGSSKVYHFPADAKISITYNDTDGKQIKNSDSDKKAWNKSYSTTAPSEITYQGVKYVFSSSEVTSGGSPIVAEGSNQTVSFVITKAEYSVSFVYKPDKPKGVKVTGSASASKNADETAVSGSYSVTVEGGKFDKVRVGWQEMGPNDSQGTVSYQSAGSNSDSCSGSLSKSNVKQNHSYQVVVEVTIGTDVDYFYSNAVSIGAPPPTPQVTVPLTPTPLPEPIEFPVMPPPEVVVPPLPVVNVIPKPAAPAAPPYVDTGHLYQCYTGEKHTHSGSQTSYGGCYTTYVRTDYYTCTYCGGIGLVGTCSGCWGSGIRDNEDRCSQCSGGTYTANCPSCSGGEVTCGTCNGSGKTGGTCGGTITSDAASHSLVRDPYYMVCENSSCNGGRIKCSSCGGDGKTDSSCTNSSCVGGLVAKVYAWKCNNCGNTGSYNGLTSSSPPKCDNCRYSTQSNGLLTTSNCPTCGGDDKIEKTCSSCGGEGSTECSRCEGDGYFTRYVCDVCGIAVKSSETGSASHNYKYTCSKCGASASGTGTCSKSTEKTCSECNGNKKVDCRQTINYNGDSKECSGGSASFSCGTCNGDGYVEGLCSYCAHHDGSGYSSTCTWGDGYYGDCDMSTTYYDVACGKTAGKYYSGSTECSPLCEKVITAYTPVYSDIKTTIIDVKDKGWTLENYDSAYITVLASGHTSYKSPIELDGSYSALNTSLYNSAQNITLTAGGSGWYLNDAHAGTPKTVSMTMKVTIDSKVTVAFNAGYGTCSTKTKDYYYGSTYGSLPTPAAPTGYSFSGWYTGENGTETKVTTSTSVVDYHNHSLYAYYTPNPAAGYTVTWDARPEGSPRGYFSGNQRYFTQSPIYYGQAITNPEGSIVADTGYRFEGWRLNGTFYKKGTISGNYPWTNSTTFTAQYDAIESIVTFNANGGSVSETSRRVKYDQAYRFDAAANTLRAFPIATRSGYAFDGWWTAASGGTEVKETDTVKITSNQTLYAHWKDTTTIVTYVADNPGAVKSLSYSSHTYTYTVADGIKYVFPAVTLNEGYELAAADPWYYGSDAVTTGHELKTYDDHTITLKTRPKTMNVNFNSNGGAWPGGNGGVWTVSYGKEYGWYMAGGVAQRRTFPGTTKTGYTFLRWTQAENEKTPVTETTVVGKLTNHTLYAYWGNNKYTVTFNTNGADTCSTTTLSRVVAFGKPWTYVYSNQSVMDEANGLNAAYTEVPLPEVQKYGYHFDGWKLTDTSGNEIKDENGNPVFISTNKYNKYYNVTTAQDVIAVAVWTADTHTITIDKNDSDNVSDKATIGTTTVTVSCDTSINTDIQMINLQRPGYKLLGLFTSDGVKVFDGNLFAVETTKNANGTYPSPSYWVYKSYVNNNASLLWNRHDNVTLYAHWTPINYYLDYADREWKNEYASNDGNVSYTEYQLAYNDVSHVVPGVDQFSATLMKYREIAYDFNDWDKTPNAAWLSYTSDRAHKFAVYEWTGYDVYKKSSGTLAYHRNLPYNVQAQEVEFPGRMTTVDKKHLYLFPTFGAVEYVTLPTATLRGYTFKGWTEVPNEGIVYGNVYQPKTDLPGKTTLYASWTPNPYTITLKPSKYGTVAKSAYTMIFDSTQNNNISSASPARTGYTFTGWYTAESGGTMVYKADGSYNPSCSYWNAEGEWVLDSDITLYAHWAENSYVVSFDINCPDVLNKTVFLDASTTNVTFDKTISSNVSNSYLPSRIGYTFNGWYSGANGGSMVYDTSLYAYNSAKTGYYQTYWKNDTEFPSENPGVLPVWKYAADTTVYAKWTPLKYNLTIQGNKGTGSTAVTVPYNTVTLTFDSTDHYYNGSSHTNYLAGDLATRTGYKLTGYYTQASGGIKLYTSEGLVANSGTIAYSGYATDYYFYQNKYKVASDITVYAQWEPNTYEVTLNLNDTGAIPKAKIPYGSFNITFDTIGHVYGGGTKTDYLRSNIPTRTGYTFLGWYTQASGGTKVYNADGSITKEGTYFDADGEWVYANNVTFYAQWSPNSYNVTINGNKGTGSSLVTVPYSSYTLTFDSTNHYYNGSNHSNYLAGNLATRPGYTLTGYYTSESDGIKLYNADGAVAESGTVTYLGYESGYYFYQNKYKYASGMTIHAQWAPITYTVTLNLNDTGAIPVAKVPYSSFTIIFDDTGHTYGGSTKTDYLASNLPTRVGYTFDGWYTAASGGTKIYNADGSITKEGTYFDASGRYVNPSNVTLYAHWTVNQYTLTLDGNKGAGSTLVTVPYNTVTMTYDSANHNYNGQGHADYLAGNLAYRTGYILQGYYTAPSGGIKIYNANGSLAAQTIADSGNVASASGYYYHSGLWKVANDLTLYAQWKAKEYDIVLNDRGATSTNHTESVHMTYDKKGASIVVPTKTGYTFHGYYTGTHGSGTKYYDASGACVKEWTEDDKTQIFAYWTQDDVILPDSGDRTGPTPLPELDSEGSVGRTDAKGLLYADDYNNATGALDDLQPYLVYDTTGTEGAIPGTEKLAFRAKMGSWLLHYKLHRNAGTDYIRFYVTVPYRTQYEQSADEELVISAQQSKTYTFVVPKVWSYWEILESGMYYPDKVTITNSATKDTSFIVNVERTGSFSTVPPGFDIVQYGAKENHVFWDEYDADGYPVLRITLTEEQYIISDVLDTLPDIDPHLSIVTGNAAWDDERQADVKSDRYVFDGNTILFDTLNDTGNGSALLEENLPSENDAIAFTDYRQTYTSGVELNELVPNGTYATGMTITYVGDSTNISAPATKEVTVTDVNELNIHTPVACEAVVVDGIEEGVLTLRDEINFFTLRVDNIGTHRLVLGYGAKDFRFALSGKTNLAMADGSYLNQVKFPFDVFVDVGADSDNGDGTYTTSGDYCFPAGTWLTISDSEFKFYVPVSLAEGEYTINFRSIAVNCPQTGGVYTISGNGESNVNLDKDKYIAEDTIKVNVKLHVEDFDVTNTNDPDATDEILSGKQSLVLKKGYKFAYRLTTLGSYYGADAKVRIVPSYYYISKDGFERVQADLYYSAVVNGKKQSYVLAGSAEESGNLHTVYNNSDFLNVSAELLKKSGTLAGLSDFVGMSSKMYNGGLITLSKYFRMFPGLSMNGLPAGYCRTCHVAYEAGESAACGHSLTNTSLYTLREKLLQNWHGEFSIPADSHVIRTDTMKGYCNACGVDYYVTGGRSVGPCGHSLATLEPFSFDEYTSMNTLSGEEEFFMKDGYLAVSFDIQVMSDAGEWITFTDWKNTKLYTDFADKLRYEAGDVVWYDLSASAADDYEVGGGE